LRSARAQGGVRPRAPGRADRTEAEPVRRGATGAAGGPARDPFYGGEAAVLAPAARLDSERGAGGGRGSARPVTAALLAAAARLDAALRVSRRLVLVASCAALAALAVPPARATALTSAQVRELARAARSDPASLARLRTVDAVDGRRVDLGLALAGATGSELDRRLAVLGGAAGRGAGTSKQPREAARGILAERRFRRHEAPR